MLHLHHRSKKGRARPLVTAVAGVAVAGLFVAAGGTAAMAAPTDGSQAEGNLVSGSLAGEPLSRIVQLQSAYSATPGDPTGEQSDPLDVSVLDALELGLGDTPVHLFGSNGVIQLGAAGQYADTGDSTDARGASGAVGEDGTIQVGDGGDPSEDASLNLTPLLNKAGVDALISDLKVQLGAIAASADADPDGSNPSGDYTIADGTLTLKSPAVSDLADGITSELGDISDAINAAAGDDGTLQTALDGVTGDLVDPLTGILKTVPGVGALVSVDNVGLKASLSVDLQDATNTILNTPLVSSDGAVSIDLGQGTVTLDLAKLVSGENATDLNGLAPNTELLSSTVIDAAVQGASTALDGLAADIVQTAEDALNSTAMSITLTAHAGVVGVPLVDIDVVADGTLGGFLKVDGADAPTLDASGTKALGAVPVGDLVDALVGSDGGLLGSILGAVGTPLESMITDAGLAESTFTPLVTTLSDDLSPLFGALNSVVSLTANVQETPGTFVTTGERPDGSFTERALALTLIPGDPLAQVNLASASVGGPAEQATVADVAITSPTDGQEFTVPSGGSTDVPVSGTGEPGASVGVELTSPANSGSPTMVTVGDDGTWSTTLTNLPARDDYTVTATQTVDDQSSEDSVDFSVTEESGGTTSTTQGSTSTTQGSTSTTQGSTSTTEGSTSTTEGSTSTTEGSTSTTEGTTSTSTTEGSTSTTEGTTSTTAGTTSTTEGSTSTTDGSTSTTTSTGTDSTSTTEGTTSTTEGTTSTTEGTTSTTEGTTSTTEGSTSTTEGSTSTTTGTESTSTTTGTDSTSTTTSTGTDSTSTTEGTTSTTTGTESTSTTKGTDSTSTSEGTASTSTSEGSTSTSTSASTSTSTGSTSEGATTSTSTGTTAEPSATVKYTKVERGAGVTQVFTGTGFQPGETVKATVHSTPITLNAETADAAGTVKFTLPIGSDFALGAHHAELVGSDSGAVSEANNHTQFTVVAAEVAAATNGGGSGGGAATGGGGLADTGLDVLHAGGIAFVFLVAGGFVLALMRRKREQSS